MSDELAYAGVRHLRDQLRDGSLKASELVDLYLARIERLNPALNAFTLVRAEEARREAEEAQRALDAGDGAHRPLLGVPFAVKDEQDVAGCVTSWGAPPRRPHATADHPLVGALRAAGAVVIGKTTLPELGMHAFTESPAWGATRNPWDRSRTPGGSSGGSAAAVAAGLVPFATAGDGGGSIRIPASCCNLFGLKVQRGRLDEERAMLTRLAVWGVLTQRVEDAALVYDAVSPAMSLEAAVASPPGRLRIGMTFRVGTPAKVDDSVRDAVVRVASALRTAGHTVTPVELHPGRWEAPFSLVGLGVLAEAGTTISDAERATLEPRTRSGLRLSARVPQRAIRWALRRQEELSVGAGRLFEGVDLILSPTLARPPAPIGRWADTGLVRTGLGEAGWCPFTSLWNFVGLPAAAIPAGFTPAGLPVGAQLLAPADGEATLISVAAQLQGVLGWPDRHPPL
jgi:amidase